MGIFGAFGRAFSGKQPYESETQVQTPQSGDTTTGRQPVQTENKIVPVVRVGRIENQVSGSRLAVYADIRNDSIEPVGLDRITMCGMQRELDMRLGAGEIRQLLIYNGPLLVNRPSESAEIQYRRISDGRYFKNFHTIRSRQEDDDEGFIVEEMLLRGPIKTI
jgi:hypothetical protein